MATDLVFPTLSFLSLGDLDMDAELPFEPQHVLDFGVLSLDFDGHDVTDADVVKTLNDCLFESQLVLSEPCVTISQTSKPPTAAVAKRALYRPKKQQTTKPPAKRPRDRKRSPQQRDIENSIRKAKERKRCDDRDACIKTEALLRSHIRQWIAMFAYAMGLPLDARIQSHLPLELRHIMARSDVAMEAYAKFTGWDKLCQTVNGLGEWW